MTRPARATTSQTIACPLCRVRSAAVIVQDADVRLARCRECGLVCRDPLGVDATAEYYDFIYEHRTAGGDAERARRDLYLDFLRRLGAPRGRLADVGCGTGEFVRVARAAGWEAHGVDASRVAVERGRREGLRIEPSLRAFPDRHFAVVTLWNVVEFFADPAAELAEVFRVLVPGGLVFLRTPNAGFHLATRRLASALRVVPRLVAPLRHTYVVNPLLWNPRSLAMLLEVVGFVGARIDNARLSTGDPYGGLPSDKVPVVQGVKRGVAAAAEVAAALSARRLLLAPSLVAVARRPVTAPGAVAARATYGLAGESAAGLA